MLCSCATTTQKFANSESFKSYSESTWDATNRSFLLFIRCSSEIVYKFHDERGERDGERMFWHEFWCSFRIQFDPRARGAQAATFKGFSNGKLMACHERFTVSFKLLDAGKIAPLSASKLFPCIPPGACIMWNSILKHTQCTTNIDGEWDCIERNVC